MILHLNHTFHLKKSLKNHFINHKKESHGGTWTADRCICADYHSQHTAAILYICKEGIPEGKNLAGITVFHATLTATGADSERIIYLEKFVCVKNSIFISYFWQQIIQDSRFS